MRLFIIYVLTFVAVLTTEAARYARYNQAGYHPNKKKRVIVISDDNCSGFNWRIRDAGSSIVLSGTIGGSVTGTGNYMPKPFNHVIDFSTLTTEGTYSFEIDNVNTFYIEITCRPYADFIHQTLRMFRVRRSGSADALDHNISHLGDVSCPIYDRVGTNNANWTPSGDGKTADMLGGWYDAGDYIKFTLTNAYSAYFILRSYQTYPELFDGVNTYSTSGLNDILDEAKHGLDFLMKTMPDPNEFIIQTGGAADHNEWPPRLPEDDNLDGSRECYSAFSRTQMGLTAAALALGADIFGNVGYTTEAAAYQAKAIEIYTAAKASTTTNAWWEGGFEVFYADNSYEDNMELAAIELYKLTNNGTYLTDALNYGNTASCSYWAAWSNVNMTAHSRLHPHDNSLDWALTCDLNNFQGIANNTNNVWGVPHNSTWGSLFSFFGVAHGALQYQVVTGNTTYENMGIDVLDYTFGLNPWGLGFVATQDLPNTITSSYAQIYRLQPGLFPTGEIAEGPTSQATHNSNIPYFSPPHNPALWHSEFNTSDFTFFEQDGDFVCMETTITGLADGLFLMTIASKALCNSPLPVDLLTFDATEQSDHIQLNWTSLSEVDFSHYEVEHSQDFSTFTSLGVVMATGSVGMITNYQFNHNAPVQGTNYYRLKMVDTNGNIEYSNTVAIDYQSPLAISIYPNPTRDNFLVSFTNDELHQSDIKLFDITGKAIPISVHKDGSDYAVRINDQFTSNGFYVILVKVGDRYIRKQIFITE